MISYICDDMKDRKLTATEMGRLSPEEYRVRPASGVVIVLDNVRSAYNVGSAFRSADAFGVDEVWLCGICAAPPSAEIHKTALGAELSVPWEHVGSTLEVVERLKQDGYTVFAVEQTEHSIKLASGGSWFRGSESPSGTASQGLGPTAVPVPPLMLPRVARVPEGDSEPGMKRAFIFGNEVDGVQQEVVDAADFSLEIPQHGTKHSLNVAVTIGIVLFAATA